MEQLSIGMYLRCVFSGTRYSTFPAILGQVRAIIDGDGLVDVCFHGVEDLSDKFSCIPQSLKIRPTHTKRARLRQGAVVWLNGAGCSGVVLARAKSNQAENDYWQYHIMLRDGTVSIIDECSILAKYDAMDFNAANQLVLGQCSDPRWYLARQRLAAVAAPLLNAPDEFYNLYGLRIHLYRHQADAIIKALGQDPCRLMLADEVGMGKTIETCAILKAKLTTTPDLSALFIVPESLAYQWQSELKLKFKLDVPVLGKDEIEDSPRFMIVSYGGLENKLVYKKLTTRRWDYCILDEAHQLLRQEEHYNLTLALSKVVPNLLMLSATPILRMKDEYRKLLVLLHPGRFTALPEAVFNDLLSRQKLIRDTVSDLMDDLGNYEQYDLSADYVDRLTELNEDLADPSLGAIISQIDPGQADHGLKFAKLALAYISGTYQFERNVVRNRRADVSMANIRRASMTAGYDMAGADVGWHEEECYERLLGYLDYLNEAIPDSSLSKFIELALSSFFSSPWALRRVLEDRLAVVGGKVISQEYRSIISMFGGAPGEVREITSLLHSCSLWQAETEQEIDDIARRAHGQRQPRGRFGAAMAWLCRHAEGSTRKYIIFSGFTETAQRIERCIDLLFGELKKAVFYRGMTGRQMQAAASAFQNRASCRFIICDESGGEGRNFQAADVLVHFDLPWSPAVLEQRIGRLDRIGRDHIKPVLSAIVHTRQTLEETLFCLYHDGMNIFNQSLCGMELIFEDLYTRIHKAIASDLRFGLKNAAEDVQRYVAKMREEIQKEHQFDHARFLDRRTTLFTELYTPKLEEELDEAVTFWLKTAGVRKIERQNIYHNLIEFDLAWIDQDAAREALLLLPENKASACGEIAEDLQHGTFCRTFAVNHEDVTFLAPNSPLFETALRTAYNCQAGKCAAFHFSNCTVRWEGFVTAWNIGIPLQGLLECGVPADRALGLKRYLPPRQFQCLHRLSGEQNEQQVLGAMNALYQRRVQESANGVPITSRVQPIQIDSSAQWAETVKAAYKDCQERAITQARLDIDMAGAAADFDRMANEAIAMCYFGMGFDKDAFAVERRIAKLLLEALSKPVATLDSIAYIRLGR